MQIGTLIYAEIGKVMIKTKEVKRIANLARIELSEKEIEKYQEQLGSILDYVDKLKEVETSGVETADGGTRDLENVWREDQQSTINNQQSTKNLIEMAPEAQDGQVKVKPVL